MSVKIKGREHLDNNLYDQIKIGLTANGKPLIVALNRNVGYIEESKIPEERFSDSIANLDSDEKIIETVRYFLDNNIIYYIREDQDLIVTSQNGSSLIIKNYLENNLIKRIKEEIYNKYENDRANFLIENKDIREINFSVRNLSSAYYGLSFDNKIFIELDMENIDFSIREIFFLNNFINESLSKHDDFAYIHDIKILGDGSSKQYFNIECGDTTISIPLNAKYICKIVEQIVMESNYQKYKENSKQYRLIIKKGEIKYE